MLLDLNNRNNRLKIKMNRTPRTYGTKSVTFMSLEFEKEWWKKVFKMAEISNLTKDITYRFKRVNEPITRKKKKKEGNPCQETS